MKNQFYAWSLLTFLFFHNGLVDGDVISLTTEANSPRSRQSQLVNHELAEANSFLIEVWVDPTEDVNGNHQAVAGVTIGMAASDADPFQGPGHVRFEIREGSSSGFWDVWVDGVNEPRREPRPKPREWMSDARYQHPWDFHPS